VEARLAREQALPFTEAPRSAHKSQAKKIRLGKETDFLDNSG
jgi:hypothetical protein